MSSTFVSRYDVETIGEFAPIGMEPFIICPQCGRRLVVPVSVFHRPAETMTFETGCMSCGKQFMLEAHLSMRVNLRLSAGEIDGTKNED